MPGADSPDEARFQAEVRANLRRNYLVHLGHGLLGQTGMRIINAPTFIPAYIFALSGSDVDVGIARAVQYAGMLLSPILAATLIEHRRRVLSVGIWNGAYMRLQILGLALAGLLLPDPWRLYVSWALLGLCGYFLGIQGVVFNMLISKVIPVEKRGFLLGLRTALSGLTASAIAIAAGRYFIDSNALGNGYATTFLLAFGLTSLGLCLLFFVREPESPFVRVPSKVLDRLRELPDLLRSDAAFTRYFLARALATIGRMAVPFYVIYAGRQVELSGQDLGVLTGAFVVAMSTTNLLWGSVADRRGFRFVFLLALSLWILAVVLLMSTADFQRLVLVFGALGAGLGGFQFSSQNLVLEFGSRQNLPMRIAVANSASEAVATLGAVAGGVLAALFSYVALFWIAITFQLAALIVVLRFVDEPRRRTLPGSSPPEREKKRPS